MDDIIYYIMDDIIYYIMSYLKIECHSCVKRVLCSDDIKYLKKVDKYYYCNEKCYGFV